MPRKKKRGNKTKKLFRINPKQKKFNIIILFVIAILFSVSITEFAYFFYKIKYIRVYDLKLKVSESLGFALGAEKEEINLGTVPPGNSAIREIFIFNNYTIPLLADFVVKGEVKQFVYIEDNNLVVYPGESRTIHINAIVPEGTAYGEYSGKLSLIFKRI